MAETGVALPIPYTAAEVSRIFEDMLAAFDFTVELQDLGIGAFSVFKRNRGNRHLTAVCIALWRVALEKSFPNDAAKFFTHFLNTHPKFQGQGRAAGKLRDLVAEYNALIEEKKNTDFSTLAEKVVAALEIPAHNRPKFQLRLSLHIRARYELIFEKLI